MREVAGKTHRRRWLPWGLLACALGLLGLGGWLGARSLSALLARNAQLEREADESEARVAELQVLRASMERRLRALERQPVGPESRRAASAQAAREADARLAGREAARKTLESKLKEELRRGQAFLDASDGWLRVTLSGGLLFEPGHSALSRPGAELLARVGGVLAPLTDHAVQVASHTEESPAPGAPPGASGPATAWELSTARAVAVVRALVDAVRLPPERLSATGHASLAPVVGTPEGAPRGTRGRRVELLIVPLATPPDPVSARAAAPTPRP
ncbi:OmpA family protein [Myxococcaceae bacterium GXIMD 01537]